MSRHDYIPANAAQFNFFMRNIINYCNAKIEEWTNIPEDRLTELTIAYTQFANALSAAEETPTSAFINERRRRQAEATRVLRAFVNQFLRFPPVTDFDRDNMHIPNRDLIRTDHKTVTETVDFVLHVRNQREVVVDFWIEGAAHKAKPEGYDGAVLVWETFDTTPDEPSPADQFTLANHTMASRTPFTLHFLESERGKTVYVALQWQNERGKTGPWSDIKSAVVP
jgi:hypothetical protein|uniref:Uncharacterized protein n=1 Tax=uncultured bacterium contig00021 TaxID=1181511 RepID=A0A806KHL5_9BACT|nr:hypothetical protein [uncultured bacterium contig00021]